MVSKAYSAHNICPGCLHRLMHVRIICAGWDTALSWCRKAPLASRWGVCISMQALALFSGAQAMHLIRLRLIPLLTA